MPTVFLHVFIVFLPARPPARLPVCWCVCVCVCGLCACVDRARQVMALRLREESLRDQLVRCQEDSRSLIESD